MKKGFHGQVHVRNTELNTLIGLFIMIAKVFNMWMTMKGDTVCMLNLNIYF